MSMDSKKFDKYAETYQRHHGDAIAASGEGTDYFHDYKIACLKRLGLNQNQTVLDYGCGVGNLVERLLPLCASVSGYDTSLESLEECDRRAEHAMLYRESSEIPQSAFDVVVISCVLHHVSPERRQTVMKDIYRILKPGGKVVVFEHNPWNPLTLQAVKKCAFDDDAILLSSNEIKNLLRTSQFIEIETKFIVFFPKALSFFRWLEPYLEWCPLGAQTLTVGVTSKNG